MSLKTEAWHIVLWASDKNAVPQSPVPQYLQSFGSVEYQNFTLQSVANRIASTSNNPFSRQTQDTHGTVEHISDLKSLEHLEFSEGREGKNA